MRVLATLFVAAALLLLAAVTLSFVDTPFLCTGAVLSEHGWQPAVAALTLRRYHRWAHLWSGAEGRAWIRLPGDRETLFAHLDRQGDLLRITGCGTEHRGVFLASSGELIVHAREGDFRGNCLPGRLDAGCAKGCVRGPEEF